MAARAGLPGLADTKMIYNDATIIYNRPELPTGGGRRRFQAAFLLRPRTAPDHVYMVVLDEDDVQHVARFQFERR